VLTDFTWTPFHPWKLIYQDPEGSSTPGKPVFAIKASQCSSHLHWINPWIQTFWPNCSHTQCWLTRLNICPHAEDAVPRIRRLLNTWKTGFAMKESQCSGHYTTSNHEYRLFDPTAVVHFADWLDLNTFPPVEDALPRTKSLLNTWKKCLHIDGNSMFWPCYWITPWIHTFWAHRSGIQCWLASPE